MFSAIVQSGFYIHYSGQVKYHIFLSFLRSLYVCSDRRYVHISPFRVYMSLFVKEAVEHCYISCPLSCFCIIVLFPLFHTYCINAVSGYFYGWPFAKMYTISKWIKILVFKGTLAFSQHRISPSAALVSLMWALVLMLGLPQLGKMCATRWMCARGFPRGFCCVRNFILKIGSGDIHACYIILCALFSFDFNKIFYSATRTSKRYLWLNRCGILCMREKWRKCIEWRTVQSF